MFETRLLLGVVFDEMLQRFENNLHLEQIVLSTLDALVLPRDLFAEGCDRFLFSFAQFSHTP